MVAALVADLVALGAGLERLERRPLAGDVVEVGGPAADQGREQQLDGREVGVVARADRDAAAATVGGLPAVLTDLVEVDAAMGLVTQLGSGLGCHERQPARAPRRFGCGPTRHRSVNRADESGVPLERRPIFDLRGWCGSLPPQHDGPRASMGSGSVAGRHRGESRPAAAPLGGYGSAVVSVRPLRSAEAQCLRSSRARRRRRTWRVSPLVRSEAPVTTPVGPSLVDRDGTGTAARTWLVSLLAPRFRGHCRNR